MLRQATVAPFRQFRLPPGYLAAVKLLCHYWSLTDYSLLFRILDEGEGASPPPQIGKIDRSGGQVWELALDQQIVRRLDRLADEAGADATYYLCMAIQKMVADIGKPFPIGMPSNEAAWHFPKWNRPEPQPSINPYNENDEAR